MADEKQSARMRNFETVVSQPVGLTARGGRQFSLRDDVPTGLLLRFRVLPSLTDRWNEAEVELLRRFEAEAREAEARRRAEDEADGGAEVSIADQFARQREEKEISLRFAESMRAALGSVRRRYESDLCALCGEIFRWTYPALTDEELFGVWDDATWSWRGGVFSPEEAEQIIQLFMGLRGIASLPQPSAPGDTPSSTESSPLKNRASRRAKARERIAVS